MVPISSDRRVLLLAVLYAEHGGATPAGAGLTAEVMSQRAGLDPTSAGTLLPAIEYLKGMGFLNCELCYIGGNIVTIMRLTAKGVNEVDRLSAETGVNLVDLVSDGKLRLLADLQRLTGQSAAVAYLKQLSLLEEHSGRSVSLTEAGVDLVVQGKLPRPAAGSSQAVVTFNFGVLNTGTMGVASSVTTTTELGAALDQLQARAYTLESGAKVDEITKILAELRDLAEQPHTPRWKQLVARLKELVIVSGAGAEIAGLFTPLGG